MQKTILIIEDDDFLQGLEAKKLIAEGYEVLTSSSSEEAFKILEENKNVDLILLDLLLPEVNGFTILKNLRENEETAKMPVIVFSNLAEEKDVKEAKKLGIDDFMIKSNFTLDELTEKVRQLIG
jgi:two-component system OmpR family response regulator